MFRNRSIMKTARRFSRIALLTPTPALLGWKSAHNFLVAIHNATTIERVSDALGLASKTDKKFIRLSGKRKQNPSCQKTYRSDNQKHRSDYVDIIPIMRYAVRNDGGLMNVFVCSENR